MAVHALAIWSTATLDWAGTRARACIPESTRHHPYVRVSYALFVEPRHRCA